MSVKTISPKELYDLRQAGKPVETADRPLYIICRSGSRAKQACEKFIAAGISNVVAVEGGTQAWEQAGMPVLRGKKAISLERQVRIAAGLLVLLGAPLGSWLSGLMPEPVLLILFAVLMLVVAQRMWHKAANGVPKADAKTGSVADSNPNPAVCRQAAAGGLELTWRCVLLLAVVGVIVGILTGLFGVGGGFVIVPALVLVSGMEIHRAVGTSLLVISLVSVSGVGSHLVAGRSLSIEITTLFIAGGILGMGLGTLLAQRLSGAMLQKVFAIAIIGVAVFVIVQTAFIPTG